MSGNTFSPGWQSNSETGCAVPTLSGVQNPAGQISELRKQLNLL